MMRKRKKNNRLRVGLKADKKLKNSFYSFLYKKHFDWAIILAAFFTPLPYLSSKIFLFLTLKILIFILIIYNCLQYIKHWKEFQEYYQLYDKSSQEIKSLIDQELLKKKQYPKYAEFNADLISEIKKLGEEFKTDKKNSNFGEFIKGNPKASKSLLDLLNKDKKLTKTAIGSILLVMTGISHLRGIPNAELHNYRRLLLIISITLLFFILYTMELLLIN